MKTDGSQSITSGTRTSNQFVRNRNYFFFCGGSETFQRVLAGKRSGNWLGCEEFPWSITMHGVFSWAVRDLSAVYTTRRKKKNPDGFAFTRRRIRPIECASVEGIKTLRCAQLGEEQWMKSRPLATRQRLAARISAADSFDWALDDEWWITRLDSGRISFLFFVCVCALPVLRLDAALCQKREQVVRKR